MFIGCQRSLGSLWSLLFFEAELRKVLPDNVSNERYKEVRQQTVNYRKFKEMSLKRIDLSMELAKLTDKETGLLRSGNRYS